MTTLEWVIVSYIPAVTLALLWLRAANRPMRETLDQHTDRALDIVAHPEVDLHWWESDEQQLRRHTEWWTS